MPRVDLPEVVLEVFSWTGADQAFTSITGGEARLKELHVTIPALLAAHSCNVGCTPVIGSADALKYGTLSHVDQTISGWPPTGPRTPRSSSTRP